MGVFVELKKTVEENKVELAVGTVIGLAISAVIVTRPRYVTGLKYTPHGDLMMQFNRGNDKVVDYIRG